MFAAIINQFSTKLVVINLNYNPIIKSQLNNLMAYAAPESIAKDLIATINQIINDARFIDINSSQAVKLLADARKLLAVEPSEGNIVLAGVYQICNMVDKVEYHVGLANKLPCINIPNLHLNSTVALCNIGLYSKSQVHFSQITEPNSINSYEIIDGGYGSLSIIKMNELLTRAQSMKLKINPEVLELTTRAKTVLNKHNISDATLAGYADVFGSLLREKNLMLKSTWPDIVVGDQSTSWYPETIFITFKVETDPKSAAGLYKEGTKRLISKFSHIPDALHFSVEPY